MTLISALNSLKRARRRFSRFRYLTRVRVLLKRKSRAPIGDLLRFIFLDREVDTFDFDLSFPANIVNLKNPTSSNRNLCDSTLFPEFKLFRDYINSEGSGVPQEFHGRHGRYFLPYSMVRTLKPDLVIELGVKVGISSHYIVEGLRLNRNGEYISVDPVRPFLLPPTSTYIQSHSLDFLFSFCETKQSIFIISDSLPDSEYIMNELVLALKLEFSVLYFLFNEQWSRLACYFCLRHADEFYTVTFETNHLVEKYLSKSIAIFRS